MTPAAVLAAAVTSAAVVGLWARRRIRHADQLAQHYLDLYVATEAQCCRLAREKAKAEEIPKAVIATYQQQIRGLQTQAIIREKLIRVLDAAVMHPTNREEKG